MTLFFSILTRIAQCLRTKTDQVEMFAAGDVRADSRLIFMMPSIEKERGLRSALLCCASTSGVNPGPDGKNTRYRLHSINRH